MPGAYPPAAPYGAPGGQSWSAAGPGYAVRPPQAQNRRKNGIVFGAVAAVAFVICTTVVDVVLWGLMEVVGVYRTWPYVLAFLADPLVVCLVAAVIVFSVDTGIRARTGAAVAAAVAVLFSVINAVLNTANVLGGWQGAIGEVTLSSSWIYTQVFITSGSIVGAWVLARRTSLLALIAAVVGGALVTGLVAASRGFGLDIGFWPLSTFAFYWMPMTSICVGASWLAVGIDKLATGDRLYSAA